MGKESSGVSADQKDPAVLQKEVEDIRDDLNLELRELDRRRHALTGSMHSVADAGPLLVGGAIIFAAVGGMVAFEVWQSRRRRSAQHRWAALRDGVGRAWQHPDQIARPQPIIANRLLTAALGAAAAEVAKRLVDRFVLRPPPHSL